MNWIKEKSTLSTWQGNTKPIVLIDEKIGRNMAEYLGLRVTGTLGVLLKAKQQRLITSFLESVHAMQAQGIFYHQTLVEKLAIGIGEVAG